MFKYKLLQAVMLFLLYASVFQWILTHAMGDGNPLEYESCYSPALSTEEVNQGRISLVNNDTIIEKVGSSKDLLGTTSYSLYYY
jgi:hypothetical protein